MSRTFDEIRTDSLVVRAPRWDATALEIVCGIANAGGGYLLIPSSHKDYLSSRRKARQNFVTIPNDIMEQLGLQCAATPVMEGADFLLELEIPAAVEPLSLHGIYWLYANDKNTRQNYESLFRHWQDDATTPWELKVLPYVEQDDLSNDMLLSIANIPLANIKDSGSLTDTVKSRIEQIGLVHPHTKKLLNVGALLLCTNPARFIPGAFIHIASFDESGHPTGVEDDIVGPLLVQIDEAMRLIENKYLPEISQAKSFVQKCPMGALREAITNAVLHKDYASGVPVRITISPHQIVVQNVGAAPDGWTETDMLGDHAPHFRNPVLATTARLLNIAPAWGDGIKKMIDECRAAGIDAPSFDLSPNHTAVTFTLPATKRGAAALKKATTARKNAQQNSSSGGQGTQQKTFAERSIAAANKLDLTQTDEYVLQILTTNGRATAQRIAQVLGVSERTVRRSFKKLREEGFIERIGSDKAGYWSIVD